MLGLTHGRELAEVLSRRPANHRGLIRAELRVRRPELRSRLRLARWAPFVRHRDHAARGDARGEPVAGREPLHRGHEVRRDAVARHRRSNLARSLHSLLPHHRLLDGGEVLQGREEAVDVLGAANLGDEVAHLLGDRQQTLVLVVVAVGEERHELGPGPLRSQRRCDRGQAPDAVQTELDVLVLEIRCGWVMSVGGRRRVRRERGDVASRVGRGSRAAAGRVFPQTSGRKPRG